MKLRAISRIFVLFAIIMMVMLPSLSFAADSTMLSNPAVLNANLQKGSGGGVPVGTVITWPSGSNPEDAEDWLECNGQAISRAAYPELYAVVGGRVPDYQGMFLRGVGGNAGALGVSQKDMTAMKIPIGTINNVASGRSGWEVANPLTVSGAFRITASYTGLPFYRDEGPRIYYHDITLGGGDAGDPTKETRPVNTAVRYLIRAKP